MGVGSLCLIDFDTAEIENCAPQGYRPDQLGTFKTTATLEDCRRLNPEVQFEAYSRRFAKSDWKMLVGRHVFACADSMDTRKNIWEGAGRAEAKWFGDARVAGETVRVLAEANPRPGGKYGATLFTQEEAHQGTCHARMVMYGAATAASLLVAMFAQSLRGCGDQFCDRTLNLLAWELFDS
jgi:hypothetical protein